jgi:transmembrane sensor
MPHDDTILAQATDWAVRAGDSAFEDWDAFTSWLAESPAHAEAYDRVAAAVAEAAGLESTRALPANDEELPQRRQGRRWFGGAIAASLAVVLALGFWQFRDDRYTVVTAPGELRSVALADGGRIDLEGGTRLVLDHNDARFASLEEGQALFTIRHEPGQPFNVKLGDDEIVDVGTVFDVRRDRNSASVAVAEGSVVLNPDDQSVHLKAGEMVVRDGKSARYVVSQVPVEQVGEWREGRLTFRQASLGEIAERLTRATGVSYTAAPGNAGDTFSGSVVVAPLRSDPAALGPLLGVKLTRSGQGWVIGTQ